MTDSRMMRVKVFVVPKTGMTSRDEGFLRKVRYYGGKVPM
jgi:hypothetical protein